MPFLLFFFSAYDSSFPQSIHFHGSPAASRLLGINMLRLFGTLTIHKQHRYLNGISIISSAIISSAIISFAIFIDWRINLPDYIEKLLYAGMMIMIIVIPSIMIMGKSNFVPASSPICLARFLLSAKASSVSACNMASNS